MEGCFKQELEGPLTELIPANKTGQQCLLSCPEIDVTAQSVAGSRVS